jgi:hypothetical protein
MKTFNLDEALKGAPVVSECGYPVKIAGYNPDANTYDQLAGWMNGSVYRWSKDGEYSHNDPFRLFMAAATKKEWIVRMSDKWIAGPYSSLEQAENATINLKKDGTVTIHEITITQ